MLLCIEKAVPSTFRRGMMRSDLVFSATTYVSNRYMLTKLAAKATRKFHRPNTRVEDTTNDVLMHLSRSNAMASKQ